VKKLQVHEIFSSINGEISAQHQGSMCTFIRLQGCNLRCAYCDTKRAQDIEVPSKQILSKEMTNPAIMKEVKKQGNKNIVITGGEPMVQYKNLEDLIIRLRQESYSISIETNGSIIIPHKYPWINVDWVIDWKLPYSGECMKMCPENYYNLQSTDIVKFVVSNYSDFQYAVRMAEKISKECLERIYECPIFATYSSPWRGMVLEFAPSLLHKRYAAPPKILLSQKVPP
jgi:7-carboxy-7-deazaguanine synthase